jgi:hypothetical protein
MSNKETRLMASSMSVVNNEHSNSNPINENLPILAKQDFLPPQDLCMNLIGDVIVACGVTLGIAPFMSVIDKSIVQRAAATHTIVQSCAQSITAMIRNPVEFVKSPMFLMMWGVYAATYTTANSLKTILEYQDNQKSDNMCSDSMPRIGTFSVFALTTSVNSTSTMYKDRFYARHFGTTKTAAKMPLITYGLWGARDCMVIGSSFILPGHMSDILERNTNLDRVTSLQISQLTCPVLTQLVAGPTQLLGLDFYNRPLTDLSYRAAIVERMRFQYSNFTSIVGARIARIAPAYGIGGVCNTHFRDKWRNNVTEKDFLGLAIKSRH